MDVDNLPLLPLGTSDFATLRMRGQIYVDKTALIYRLASKPEKFFLSRPRRFGKSLLISTFESLFKYGLRDFKGLAIEKLWKDEGHYRVVRLDFSSLKNFSTIEEFRTIFDAYFSNLMLREGLEVPAGQAASGLLAFGNWLTLQPSSSVVLLIDEYDAPLTACLNNPELFELARRHLSTLYAIVKEWDRVLRFFFITGITKFSKASIFSEMNNLTDISLSSVYGTLLGYTRNEVETSFGAHLAAAAEIHGILRDELMERLTEHYDGFCFSKNLGPRVFAPWSLLKFLSCPEDGFENYWFESAGNPTVLQQYLKGHNLRDPNDYFKKKYLSSSVLGATAADPEHIDDLALLAQAGYLTIKGEGTGSFLLGYPNKEVADSIACLYRNRLLAGRDINELGAAGLRTAVVEGDADFLMDQLNQVFLALDYRKYPIGDESTCRNYAQLILTLGSDVRTFAELHNALGRSDLEVETSRIRWVFEFKFQRKGESADNLLEKALLQIRERRYGEGELGGRRLLRVAAVFSEEKRVFAAWKACAE